MAAGWNLTLPVIVVCLCFSLSGAGEHRRLRFQRAVCTGPLVEPGYFCRWTNLECSCVEGTYCSLSTHTCEVCQITTEECTSPCPYPCQNGGLCELDTASCSCPAGYVGVDCSIIEIAPSLTEPPHPPVQPSPCESGCLNGGVCVSGNCDCPQGYFYADCSLCVPHQHPTKCIEHCRVECLNSGDCLTTYQKCHCTEDYTGEDCTLCIPSKASMSCTDHCSVLCTNDATCNSKTGKCECTSGWTGSACQEPCPPGWYGQNCLERCECQIGPCDPVTGLCLCDPNSPKDPDCAVPCDCIVDGMCRTKAYCPTVGTTPESPAPPVLGPTTPGHQGKGGLIGDSFAEQQKVPMIAVIATAAGAIVLLLVVIILIAFLVKSRRQNTRKLKHTEEAEQIPMNTGVADNTYEDASSTPMNSLRITQSPFRPTSGYEDVTDIHKNMPDLLPEPDEISPYATTGNITIHANAAPAEYSYVRAKDLKAFQGESRDGEFYDKLNFSPWDKTSCKPAKDGLCGALKDDGTYDDASSSQISVPLYDDPDYSGYAKMSPSLNNRKTSSLKQPKNDLRFDIHRKAASLKSPRTDAAGSSGAYGRKQPYENTYVGFDPKTTASDVEGGASQGVNPPQAATQKYVSPPTDPEHQREIPQYAKPMKRKSQLDQQEAPQYAKPNKPKSQTNSPSPSIPQYAKPNKKSSIDHQKGGPNGFSDQSKSPQMKNEGAAQGSRPGAGYAHLMHATTPSQH